MTSPSTRPQQRPDSLRGHSSTHISGSAPERVPSVGRHGGSIINEAAVKNRKRAGKASRADEKERAEKNRTTQHISRDHRLHRPTLGISLDMRVLEHRSKWSTADRGEPAGWDTCHRETLQTRLQMLTFFPGWYRANHNLALVSRQSPHQWFFELLTGTGMWARCWPGVHYHTCTQRNSACGNVTTAAQVVN